MAATNKKINATCAALEWVGSYESAADNGPEEQIGSITMEEAFEAKGNAAAVKRAYDFPDDLVDAYAMLRRSYEAMTRR